MTDQEKQAKAHEEEGKFDRLSSFIERMANAIERIADTNDVLVEIAQTNLDISEEMAACTRATYDIMAEREGYIIEENSGGVPVACDMADSEFRDFVRRRLHMERLGKEEQAREAAAMKAALGEE